MENGDGTRRGVVKASQMQFKKISRDYSMRAAPEGGSITLTIFAPETYEKLRDFLKSRKQPMDAERRFLEFDSFATREF